MTRTSVMFSSLAAAVMLAAHSDTSAVAEQSKPKPKPAAGTYSKTLTFTLSTTTPSRPGKGLKAKKK